MNVKMNNTLKKGEYSRELWHRNRDSPTRTVVPGSTLGHSMQKPYYKI